MRRAILALSLATLQPATVSSFMPLSIRVGF